MGSKVADLPLGYACGRGTQLSLFTKPALNEGPLVKEVSLSTKGSRACFYSPEDKCDAVAGCTWCYSGIIDQAGCFTLADAGKLPGGRGWDCDKSDKLQVMKLGQCNSGKLDPKKTDKCSPYHFTDNGECLQFGIGDACIPFLKKTGQYAAGTCAGAGYTVADGSKVANLPLGLACGRDTQLSLFKKPAPLQGNLGGCNGQSTFGPTKKGTCEPAYFIEGGACYQFELDSVNCLPYVAKGGAPGIKAGACASAGFTVAGGSKVERIPKLGLVCGKSETVSTFTKPALDEKADEDIEDAWQQPVNPLQKCKHGKLEDHCHSDGDCCDALTCYKDHCVLVRRRAPPKAYHPLKKCKHGKLGDHCHSDGDCCDVLTCNKDRCVYVRRRAPPKAYRRKELQLQ